MCHTDESSLQMNYLRLVLRNPLLLLLHFDNLCIHLWWVMGFISTKATVACLTLSMVMVHGCGLVVHLLEHGHGSVGPRLAIFGNSLNFLWERLSCFDMSDLFITFFIKLKIV